MIELKLVSKEELTERLPRPARDATPRERRYYVWTVGCQMNVSDSERLESALEAVATGGVAPAARDDVQGRFKQGDAVGFAYGEIVAWGGAGSTLTTTIQHLAGNAEIVTVIAADGAPIPLSEIDTHVPAGVEIETHEGGQPSWWWLLAAQ